MKYESDGGILVDAWQSFNDAGDYTYEWPRWIIDAITNNTIFGDEDDKKTLLRNPGSDRIVEVPDGTWIIKHQTGILTSMSDEAFRSTYRPITSPR